MHRYNYRSTVHVQSVTKVSQMVTGRLACRPTQFERHWPGDPTTGQRGGPKSIAETLAINLVVVVVVVVVVSVSV